MSQPPRWRDGPAPGLMCPRTTVDGDTRSVGIGPSSVLARNPISLQVSEHPLANVFKIERPQITRAPWSIVIRRPGASLEFPLRMR